MYARITVELWDGPKNKDAPAAARTTVNISRDNISGLADLITELTGQKSFGYLVMNFGYGESLDRGLAKVVWFLFTTAYRRYEKTYLQETQ
jgi:hypothetical protein